MAGVGGHERVGIDSDRRVVFISGITEVGRVGGFLPDLWSSIIMTGFVSADVTMAPVQSLAVKSILQI